MPTLGFTLANLSTSFYHNQIKLWCVTCVDVNVQVKTNLFIWKVGLLSTKFLLLLFYMMFTFKKSPSSSDLIIVYSSTMVGRIKWLVKHVSISLFSNFPLFLFIVLDWHWL